MAHSLSVSTLLHSQKPLNQVEVRMVAGKVFHPPSFNDNQGDTHSHIDNEIMPLHNIRNHTDRFKVSQVKVNHVTAQSQKQAGSIRVSAQFLRGL